MSGDTGRGCSHFANCLSVIGNPFVGSGRCLLRKISCCNREGITYTDTHHHPPLFFLQHQDQG